MRRGHGKLNRMLRARGAISLSLSSKHESGHLIYIPKEESWQFLKSTLKRALRFTTSLASGGVHGLSIDGRWNKRSCEVCSRRPAGRLPHTMGIPGISSSPPETKPKVTKKSWKVSSNLIRAGQRALRSWQSV